MKEGWKRCLTMILALALALGPLGAVPAALAAENAVTAEASVAVYDRNTEGRVRGTNRSHASRAGLKSYEYLSFVITVHAERRVEAKRIYARINGGKKVEWAGWTLEAGSSDTWHISHTYMDALEPGIHRLDFYINDAAILTQYLGIDNDTWADSMRLPSASEISAFRPKDISPYITWYPQFNGVTGYTEYAVDFRAEYQPLGTYLACANFCMTSSDLNAAWSRVWNDVSSGGLFAYCGFQVIHDGTRLAIFSVWDTYCADSRGRKTTLHPEVVYASDLYRKGSFDGEGCGTQCMVRYDWKAGSAYRMLLQLRRSEETGTQRISMWVRDLETMAWTLLIEYDLKVKNAYMHDTCAFLENYLPEYAGEIRTMEMANCRVYSTDGRWVGAREALFSLGFDHPGSYAYGSCGNTFYAITTGLEGRCARPKDWLSVRVSRCESGAPY